MLELMRCRDLSGRFGNSGEKNKTASFGGKLKETLDSMGRYKCAYNCENSGDPDVKCFKFPLYNPRKLKKWLANMKWTDWSPDRFSVLCINHFEERCVDRTGKCVKLREDAVPTIFTAPVSAQKTKASILPRNKRRKTTGVKASQTDLAQSPKTTPSTAKLKVQSKETSEAEEPDRDQAPKTSIRWKVIEDEGLSKIKSFPHFFHGNYCAPQDIQWAPDDNAESENPEKMIEVTEPWQWLGLDLRGPLPQTVNGHRYLLTVTDYHSKWVEAVPMETCLPSHVAEHIVDIIGHFGYPLRILSRLPRDLVDKINRELKERLDVTVALLVYHQQTGTLDLTTQELIYRMVRDLMEEHEADWDVYLPAKVFSLCFKEHSQTNERPFSALCCKGLEPVQKPRGLNYTYSKIQESVFVVK